MCDLYKGLSSMPSSENAVYLTLLSSSLRICLWQFCSSLTHNFLLIPSSLSLSLSLFLSLCISYTRSIFSPPIDLLHTAVPQFLLCSLRKCTTLYNQLNRFTVCHYADLPWGLLVTRLCSLSLSCTVQQSEAQAGSEREASCPSYAPLGGYTDWIANKRISKCVCVCLCIRNTVFH